MDRPRESQIGMHTCARAQEPGREMAFGGVGVVVVSRDHVCRRQRGDVARHVDEQRAVPDEVLRIDQNGNCFKG